VAKTVAELMDGRASGLILLAIRKSDARMIFNPPPETKIEAGDVLIVMGEQPSLKQLDAALT
jgi:TrkA domain protein